MKNINAILPIRSGSQRVRNKNIVEINHKPLYSFIIDTLIKCKMINKIIINTDYEFLPEVYNKNNKICFVDRKENLKGNCDINLVIKSTLENCEGNHFLQTHVTNPLLGKDTIERAIELYFSNLSKNDSLFSANKLQKRFWFSDITPINHSLLDEPTTQNLEPYYEENSCIYIFSRKSFEAKYSRIGSSPLIFETPMVESIDIDYDEDLDFVSRLLT